MGRLQLLQLGIMRCYANVGVAGYIKQFCLSLIQIDLLNLELCGHKTHIYNCCSHCLLFWLVLRLLIGGIEVAHSLFELGQSAIFAMSHIQILILKVSSLENLILCSLLYSPNLKLAIVRGSRTKTMPLIMHTLCKH